MAKESSAKTPRVLTKKHMAKLEKEKRQNKLLIYGIIAVVVVIAGLIAYGILNNTVFKNMKTVAKVGNTKISSEQFQHRVSYDRYQLVQTFTQYASSYFASFFQDQLISIQDQLDAYVQFGSDSLDTMMGEAALLQKAQTMGITVTDAEVEAEIQNNLAYFPNGTPTAAVPTATITYFPTSTLTDLQKALSFHTPTATVGPTETPIPSATIDAALTAEGTPAATVEGATATATLESLTVTPTVNLTPEATATITPTATEYTEAGYKNLYATVVGSINTNTSFTEKELREYVRTVLFERKVFAEVSKTVSPEQDMIWARHILVATKEQADEVENLLKAGGDWTQLAAQYSTDTSNNTTNGDLGWFAKGTMVSAFEDVAFTMEIGSTSDPVATEFGYHIIQVLGHEVRQLTSDQLSTAQTAAYKKFIEDAKTEYNAKKYDVWASVVPSTPVIPTEYRIAATTATATP